MKKLTLILSAFYLLILVFSCRENEGGDEFIVNTALNYNIVQDGVYLFDKPDFQKNEVRVSYLKNGIWTEYFEGNLDAKYGYTFYEKENHQYIRLFVDNKDKSETITLKVKYDANTTDEIKSEFRFWNNGEEITKIWYNLKEVDKPTQGTFTIKK